MRDDDALTTRFLTSKERSKSSLRDVARVLLPAKQRFG
jgi:hypothetical protein